MTQEGHAQIQKERGLLLSRKKNEFKFTTIQLYRFPEADYP